MDEHDGSAGSGRDNSHTTARLIQRAQHGDLVARDELFDRHRQELARWAHGRLPRGTRDLRDTEDLVQDSMVRALKRLQHFEPERNGSFLAYLCQILNNLVRDEMRAAKRRSGHGELTDDLAAGDATPEQEHDAVRMLDCYRNALKKLSTDQRDALVLRLELGLPYEAIAEEMGRPNVNAVRSLVSRGLERLTRLMEPPAN
ncbi:MAG: sigma-70 family RNA polymerase sigma factor [Candidatus Eisenbacteria bacterium]